MVCGSLLFFFSENTDFIYLTRCLFATHAFMIVRTFVTYIMPTFLIKGLI